MGTLHRFSLCLLLLVLVSGAFAQQVTTSTLTVVGEVVDIATTGTIRGSDAVAVDLLNKLEAKYREVETISGTFNQIKRSAAFLEEIPSQAVFYFKKPGKFRCDYLPPNESVNIVADNTAWLYIPEIKQVEKYYLGKSGAEVDRLNRLLLGFGISVDDVLDVYRVSVIEKDTDDSVLAVKFDVLEKNEDVDFESVTIWFNRKDLLVKRMLIDEPGDDETEIEINKVTLNETIADAKFRPFFPKDVQILEYY